MIDPLRSFDQQMAGHIKTYMEETAKIKFLEGAVPAVELTGGGRKKVTWQLKDGTTASDEYDTVLLAIGRNVADAIGLDAAGVKVNPRSGKVPVSSTEQTNVPHIYALGDIIDGEALDPPSALTELTPVAIQAGRLLASRLFVDGFEGKMDYGLVPTTVYTPIEYGGGLAEDAIAKLGEKNVEVYHSYFKPLEWTVPHRGDNACYAKIICDLTDSERVIGLHVCGPNAGEMTQGSRWRCAAARRRPTSPARWGSTRRPPRSSRSSR